MGKNKIKAMAARTARRRLDTFGTNTDQDNANYFNQIYIGQHPSYSLNRQAATKTDYKGRQRHCWAVVSKQNDSTVNQIRSAKAYRLAVLWCIYYAKEFWKGGFADRRRAALERDLPRIKGKQGDHSRHRCGNDWCCNPGHITIGTRTSNEKDKHYHYFLNHPDAGVRQRFIQTFGDLCKKERLF